MPAVVGGALTGEGDGGVGVDQGVVVEALRGLDGTQPGPDGGGDDLLGVARLLGRLDLLDGVGDGQRGDDGDRAFPYGLDHGVHGVDGDERAGRVVDEDGADALGERLEPEVDGLLAGLTAGDDEVVGPFGEGVGVEEVLDLGGAVGGCDHDDERDRAGGGHRSDGVDEHGGAVQRAQRLGGARTEAYAPSGRRDHHGGTRRTRFV